MCLWILFSADSPVLWIRVDPEMTLLRKVVFEQPDYQWQYQLRYERDVTAQAEVSEIFVFNIFFIHHSKYLTSCQKCHDVIMFWQCNLYSIFLNL